MRFTMSASPSSTVASLPLQIDSLGKKFGAVTAVDGVTLEVRDRECLGLLGPNGAGKSTTILREVAPTSSWRNCSYRWMRNEN